MKTIPTSGLIRFEMTAYFLITYKAAMYLMAILVGLGWVWNFLRRKKWNWPRFLAAFIGGAIGYLMVPVSGVSPTLKRLVAAEIAHSEYVMWLIAPQETLMIILQSLSGILLGTLAGMLLITWRYRYMNTSKIEVEPLL